MNHQGIRCIRQGSQALWMKIRNRGVRLLALLFLAVMPLGVGCASRQNTVSGVQTNNRETHRLKEFLAEVQKYVRLHNLAASRVPPLKSKAEPEEIVAHKRALAQAIRTARLHAKRGKIFESGSGALLVRIIQKELDGPDGPKLRAAITDQPPQPITLHVNDTYPEGAPKSIMPPSLLLKLPALPKEVEYRFVDRHLILLDVEAELIVDFVLDVIQ